MVYKYLTNNTIQLSPIYYNQVLNPQPKSLSYVYTKFTDKKKFSIKITSKLYQKIYNSKIPNIHQTYKHTFLR